MITANRYHDISVGHRVVGHEGKCRHLHGHNYRVHFEVVAPDLDKVGRVLDFGVIKERLCMWLEDNWDHKFLAWEHDELMTSLIAIEFDKDGFQQRSAEGNQIIEESVIFVPFNPTAENMAAYLVKVIGPLQLEGTGCELRRVVIEETRKCSCSYTKDDK
jgi:6-pyruvoyltetrahydropterin/6-carboxytetrahydropterin synthase